MGAPLNGKIWRGRLTNKKLLGARGLFWALFAFVTYLTLTPNPDEAEKGFFAARFIADLFFHNPALADKIAHFGAYGLLGFIAVLAQIKFFGRKRWTPIALAAYGAFLEGLQGLGGVRSPELADAAANSAGALAGFAGAFALATLFAAKRRSP